MSFARAGHMGTLALLWLLTGCTHHWQHPVQLITAYPPQQKIALTVALEIQPELRTAKWERHSMGDTWVVPLGDHLVQNAELLADRLFSAVVAVSPQSGTAPIDALLVPRVVLVDQTLGIWKWSDSTFILAVEWALRTPGGATIWVDTVRGEGRGEMGNIVTGKTMMAQRVDQALGELFQRSFEAISSARSIREFAERQRSLSLEKDHRGVEPSR